MLEASKTKAWEATAQIWIEWKMDRSGGSCGSGISCGSETCACASTVTHPHERGCGSFNLHKNHQLYRYVKLQLPFERC